MPETSDQTVVAEAPAPSAPERSSGRKILEQAKADIKGLKPDAPAPADGPPPDSATPSSEPTPAPPKEEPAAEKESSRRSENKELRERIRKEVRAEFEAEQKAAESRRQSEQQQRDFDELVQRADNGDFEAKDRVLQILKSNRGMQAAIGQGRMMVLQEIGDDINKAIYSLDGLDDDGQNALLKAPSVAEFGKVAFSAGRRIEKAIHEDTIATLKAENESLKGRLAGSSPSPTATNGTSTIRAENGRFRTMHDAYLAAAADLGYRPQG